MAMQDSFEIGWIICDGPETVRYTRAKEFFKWMEENGNSDYEIPETYSKELDGTPLQFETHPHDETLVFVTWNGLFYGDVWDVQGEPEGEESPTPGLKVRQLVYEFDPKATVIWGMIVTRR